MYPCMEPKVSTLPRVEVDFANGRCLGDESNIAMVGTNGLEFRDLGRQAKIFKFEVNHLFYIDLTHSHLELH